MAGVIRRRVAEAETFLKSLEYALEKREVKCQDIVVTDNTCFLEFPWGFDAACVRVSLMAPGYDHLIRHLEITLIVGNRKLDHWKWVISTEGRLKNELLALFLQLIEEIMDALDSVRTPATKSGSKT